METVLTTKNPLQRTEGGLTLGHVNQCADDQDCREDCGASDSGQEVLHSQPLQQKSVVLPVGELLFHSAVLANGADCVGVRFGLGRALVVPVGAHCALLGLVVAF